MRYAILLLLAAAVGSNDEQEYFEQVVTHRRAFHDKSVSLVGLALIDGDRFYLYDSVAAAAKVDLSHGVFVRQKENGPSYDHYNNRWLRVTGILDVDLHGPLGFGFPCEILLKDVQLLKRPAEKQWPSDVGQFRNEMRTPIHIALSHPAGYVYAEFDVGVGGVNGVAVHNGQVTVRTVSGATVTNGQLTLPPRTHRRDEPVERRFYYRITPDGKFESVPAAEGNGWRK
jgi:hypothetical protein